MTEPLNVQVTVSQGGTLEPEEFQQRLIEGMSMALLRLERPPCLLRAPTGSGKTFVISRALANISARRDVLWFWFVPFVNLVAQTLDGLAANVGDLSPQYLAYTRNQEPSGGQVMLATVQSVARAQWRKSNYDADGDDDTRTLAQLVALARQRGLGVGMIVDEAHIALDKGTEFGKFCQWLNPEYLVMATATPKDRRLDEFLHTAGKSSLESFNVSRDDVVEARLNKRYIEAIIYPLRESMQGIADLEKTVLRQAWRCNQKLKRDLAAAGIPLVPLLLVQVANGEKAVEEAEKTLVNLCGVPPAVIGKHTAADPDPGLMTAIAHDSSKEVLIFKQSAGTGFDAPRAFVLASVKPVNDPDFAMQFIGRIMRVSPALRQKYPKPTPIPEGFDTAYVYLANAEAQPGFQAAVQATANIKSQLEGQTEKLVVRETKTGELVFTNKTSEQRPLLYGLAYPAPKEACAEEKSGSVAPPQSEKGQQSLFEQEEFDDLDILAPASRPSQPQKKLPESKAELFDMLKDNAIHPYPLKLDMPCLPRALKREERPSIACMGAISKSVAAKLDIPDKLCADAVKVALNKLLETERHTELTSGEHLDKSISVVMDRNALAREARALLSDLPQAEEEDLRLIVQVLAQRMVPPVSDALIEDNDGRANDDKALERLSRDAANWVIKRQIDLLAEGMFEAIAAKAKLVDASPLPEAMLFPASMPLTASPKNIYGVLPPSRDELDRVEQEIVLDGRAMLKDRVWPLPSQDTVTGQYDKSISLNQEELQFAKALDRCDFVKWWHRNPDRKPYAVRLLRGEHQNFFYPDFIVCLEHYPGDGPLMRLIETKENVKDAVWKSKHTSSYYGRVLFLTKDKTKLRWINEDGTLGDSLDLDDLQAMQEWLRKTIPVQI